MNKKANNQNSKNSICMKMHKINNEVLIAACDSHLIGKTLKNVDLEFFVNETFYHDIICDGRLLKEHLKMATMANLVGEKCVKSGIEAGIIDKKNIILIDGVPHAQYVIL